MSYWTPDSWWELIGGIVVLLFVLSLCAWGMEGIYKDATAPPAPPKTAQERFEDNCKSSVLQVGGSAVDGFPNTTSPDPTKWTCTWPH